MEKTKEDLIKDVTQKLVEINAIDQTASLVKNNVGEFKYKDSTYRVRKPVAFEKEEIDVHQMKKYVEFLQNPSYLFRKQIVDYLKKKGIDIVKMESDAQQLYKSEKELLKVLALTTMKKEIDNLEAQINTIRYEAQKLFLEKEELLKYCIEKQLEDAVRFYLLYLVLEIKNDDKWEKYYKTYQDFEKADDDVMLGRATQILSTLVYSDGF